MKLLQVCVPVICKLHLLRYLQVHWHPEINI